MKLEITVNGEKVVFEGDEAAVREAYGAYLAHKFPPTYTPLAAPQPETWWPTYAAVYALLCSARGSADTSDHVGSGAICQDAMALQ